MKNLSIPDNLNCTVIYYMYGSRNERRPHQWDFQNKYLVENSYEQTISRLSGECFNWKKQTGLVGVNGREEKQLMHHASIVQIKLGDKIYPGLNQFVGGTAAIEQINAIVEKGILELKS